MGDLGPSLAAWLLLPLVLYVLALGLGLLAERLARTRVPNALLAPVGFCAAIVVVMPGYRLEVGAWLAVALVLAGAGAGLALGRADLRERLNPGWAGVAGLGVYALYIAPVVLAGGWTWTGYNFVNDTAVQFLLADHLGDHGAAMPPGPPDSDPVSSGLEHIRIYLITAYPLGIHALLATLDPLVPAPLAAIYQPVIASAAALAAMALVPLARRAGLPGGAAAGAAVAALAGSLAFNYALQGNAKEVAVLAAVAIAAAVGREALTSERPVGAVALVAIVLSAAIALFSAAAVPYVGAVALALLVAAFAQRDSTLRRRIVPAAAVGIGVLGVASLSTLVKIVRFGEVASGTFGENADAAIDDLGHLLRPLRLAQTAGIWLVDDYRMPVPASRDTLNTALILLAAAAVVGAAAWLARRRETGPLLYVGAVALVLVVVSPRVSAYATGKLLAIATPAVVLMAAVGLYALWAARRRAGPTAFAGRLAAVAAPIVAVGLALGVVVSDVFSYRAVRLAPVDRMEALEDIGDRYHGRGFVLVDDFEEFAKYFMREARQNVALELITPVPARTGLRTSYLPLHADVDQMPLDYLARFDAIVQRRGADSSRPPANWERDYENGFYTAWVRRDRVQVIDHVPLQSLYRGAADVPCDRVGALAAAANDGDVLVGAAAPERVELDVAEAGIPADWQADPTVPDTVRALTPGRVSDELDFEGGRYRIWVAGSFGRDVELRVDGRRVGEAGGVNTPGEWLRGGEARIPAGRHRVELVRPGAAPWPGNRYIGPLGPLVFERVEDEALAWLPPDESDRLCGRELDWVELVRRG